MMMTMMGRLVGLNQVLPKSLSPLRRPASSKLPSLRPLALPGANLKIQFQNTKSENHY